MLHTFSVELFALHGGKFLPNNLIEVACGIMVLVVKMTSALGNVFNLIVDLSRSGRFLSNHGESI
jgi:hypothetical protein